MLETSLSMKSVQNKKKRQKKREREGKKIKEDSFDWVSMCNGVGFSTEVQNTRERFCALSHHRPGGTRASRVGNAMMSCWSTGVALLGVHG